MKIALTGATGLLGRALTARCTRDGHAVVPLTRGPGGAWDPAAGRIDRGVLEGCDAVVTLHGENVFGRWTDAKKHRIRESRVLGTRLVSDAIAALTRPPRVLVAVSAIGFYGDRGDKELTEDSSSGDDFLAHVARDWEAATQAAARAGVRVVNMRLGIVLTPTGGALATLLPAFRLGLGGHVGTGRQYFSWIALDDFLDAVAFLLASEAVRGPVNVTAPHPVTNQEFVAALGRVLGRPTLLPVPAFGLKLAFGAEAAEMMQSGQRVLPARLEAAGFQFGFPEVLAALRHLLAAPQAAR